MSRKPFFMRFVEKQETPTTAPEPRVKTGLKAGADDGGRVRWPPKQPETMKYPSDGDEEIYW